MGSSCQNSILAEEKVRQHLLHKMVHELGFPKELLVVEKALSELPHLQGVYPLPKRRADLLCFAKGLHSEHSLYPLLLIECKKEKIDQKALTQLLGYNYYVKASYIALVSATHELCGRVDLASGKVTFLSKIPSYKELIDG